MFIRKFLQIAALSVLMLIVCIDSGGAVQKGRALQPGDCIAIAAPASGMDDLDISLAVRKLESWGYRVKLAPHLYAQSGYLAGSDDLRAAELNALFADDEVDAILCLRGGYGSARILDLLDYDLVAAHPKMVIGYSDITALHAALLQKTDLVVIHGPMAIDISDDGYNYTDERLRYGLSHDEISDTGEFILPQGWKLEVLRSGRAQGKLIGGNLAVIASLCGTPYELKADGDSILFIEEVDEDSYVIDRYMRQLWLSGLLKQVKGIVVGTLRHCEPVEQQPFDYSVRQVFEQYAAIAQVPVLYNFPVGHGPINGFLPLGIQAELIADTDEPKLLIAEDYAAP